jgi:Tfp pilus assembly protein PilF
MLRDGAADAVEAGVQALSSTDEAAALARFERALELDPGRLDATHHLGVAAFRGGDLERAIDAWREVLSVAAQEGIQLPDPVQVNLARALLERGDPAAARIALEGYLHRWPLGEHAAATRAMLAELPE